MTTSFAALVVAVTMSLAGTTGASGAETGSEEQIVDATVEAMADHYEGSAVAPEPIQGPEAEIAITPELGVDTGQSFTVTAPESGLAEGDRGDLELSDDSLPATFLDTASGETRIITTVRDRDAAADFEYVINGVVDPYLVELEDGTFKVLDHNDRYVVDLAAPWAVDAAGRYLETSYSLEDSKLTQTIDYTGAVFPVVADPSWGYSVDHGVFQLVTGKEKATPARVLKELRRCFNCSFPVQGAPRAFPAVGQDIRLNASPFTCINVGYINATVEMRYVTSTSFAFTALKGHFDGAGSTISFTFYNDRSGFLHLSVRAHIMRDGGAANAVNQRIASETWNTFLANLIRQKTL
ncbi:hypothetical protein [Microbacterium sp. SSM24]|uniref:hypothetical protein n=1 Tax=Microbacterium sp. SSM24 TaxID=2991714 RepID=UPI002227F79F|nr:hypothetical protein [Microbacterium sp. SSM24]MCW3493226.1 hypothetical protein [Microbacterium sp. SSM24]